MGVLGERLGPVLHDHSMVRLYGRHLNPPVSGRKVMQYRTNILEIMIYQGDIILVAKLQRAWELMDRFIRLFLLVRGDDSVRQEQFEMWTELTASEILARLCPVFEVDEVD